MNKPADRFRRSETRDRSRVEPKDRSDELPLLVQSLIGSHFGVIEELARVPCEADDLALAVFAGRLCRTSAFGQFDAPRLVSGAAIQDEDALAACLGEAVERYAAALVAPGGVVEAGVNELAGKVISPDRFPLFTARQHRQSQARFPFRCWQRADRLSWTRARRSQTHDDVWVPAAFVYQPFQPGPNEPLIAPSLSTGLASGRDTATAKVAGLCEVIERDAVALAWLGRIQPPRIDLASDTQDGELGALVHELNDRGFRWIAFDLTTDVRVPVAAALIQGQSPIGTVVSFGSACHPDRRRALLKSLVEAAHCRMYVKSLWRENPDWCAARRYANVTTFADHARLYASDAHRPRALERWWRTPRSTVWRMDADRGCAAGEMLAELCQRIHTAGFEPIDVDLTPPDLKALGFHVVRALIPGLQPLHGNHHWPHLAGGRLRNLVKVFGPSARQPWRFNRDPHPCP